jgi:hypothetical protein
MRYLVQEVFTLINALVLEETSPYERILPPADFISKESLAVVKLGRLTIQDMSERGRLP